MSVADDPVEVLAPDARMWFVSDVHLVDGDVAYLQRFLDYLDAALADRIDALWIFGDLFEFWIGDRQGRTRFYAPLFAKIRELCAAGIRVRILLGNRDFLIGRVFEEAGAEILPEGILLVQGETRTHLSHGDQFCIHDHSYLRARRVFRSSPVSLISKILPAFVGTFLARSYRGISERKKAKKKDETGNRFHTVEDGIRGEFERLDHDQLVCGHIHHHAESFLDVDGRRRRVLTTGAWEEFGPNHVVLRDGRFELELAPGA